MQQTVLFMPGYYESLPPDLLPLKKENQEVFLLQHCLDDLQQHDLIYYPSLLHKHFLLCQTNHLLYHFPLRSQYHPSPVVTYPAPALGLCTAQGCASADAKGLGCCYFPFRHSSITSWPAWSCQHVAKGSVGHPVYDPSLPPSP